MAKDTYREIAVKLEDLEPFEGSSMSARWVDGRYVVWSYDTPVAWAVRCQADDSRDYLMWDVDSGAYSQTTDRHQALVVRHLGLALGRARMLHELQERMKAQS